VKVVGYYGETWLGDVPRQVREAEELGLDANSAPELKHNSILALTLAAEHTERIEVGTGVTIAFPRSPMVIAQAAWDLQELSKGRVNIGLGTQVKGHNQRRFSVPWTPPYQRMKDYVGMVRAVWESWQTGERPNYTSTNYTFTLMTPNFDPGPLPYPFPKISLGAVGPKMAELAGEVADVLLPHGFMTKEYLRDVLVPAAQKGLAKRGREPGDLEISVGGFFALGETQSDVELAIDRNRTPLSFYGSTRTYHAVLRHHERGALGMMLHEMSPRATAPSPPPQLRRAASDRRTPVVASSRATKAIRWR
jgi:probable F420-dependent oxidoreductase